VSKKYYCESSTGFPAALISPGTRQCKSLQIKGLAKKYCIAIFLIYFYFVRQTENARVDILCQLKFT